MRIAGAPISWGVCEVPGWGFQMSPDRVLSEMVQLGLTATGQGIGSRRRWEGSERIMSDDWSGRDCSSVVPTSDGSPLLPPSVVVCPVPIGRLFGGAPRSQS